MKKDTYTKSTIRTTGKWMRVMMRDGVNLDDPDEIKKYIALKQSGYEPVSYEPKTISAVPRALFSPS